MSFGALFGLSGDGKVKPVKASPKTLGVTPALFNQIVAYFTAQYILNGHDATAAKRYAQGMISRLNASTVSGLKTVLDRSSAELSSQALNVLTEGSAVGDQELLMLPSIVALGIQLPRTLQYTTNLNPSIISNLKKAFGKNVIEQKKQTPTDPFKGKGKAPPLPAAASKPGQQTAAQKQAQAAYLDNLYHKWLTANGLNDTPQNKSEWQSGFSPMHTAPLPGQNQQSNAAFISATQAASAADNAHYISLLNQGLLSNTAMPGPNYGSDGGGAEYSDEPYTPPSISTPDAPQAPRCGHEIFCDSQHPQCCDFHPVGSLGELISIRSLYPRPRRRKISRLSWIGGDDDEITGSSPGYGSGHTPILPDIPGPTTGGKPQRPQPASRPVVIPPSAPVKVVTTNEANFIQGLMALISSYQRPSTDLENISSEPTDQTPQQQQDLAYIKSVSSALAPYINQMRSQTPSSSSSKLPPLSKSEIDTLTNGAYNIIVNGGPYVANGSIHGYGSIVDMMDTFKTIQQKAVVLANQKMGQEKAKFIESAKQQAQHIGGQVLIGAKAFMENFIAGVAGKIIKAQASNWFEQATGWVDKQQAGRKYAASLGITDPVAVNAIIKAYISGGKKAADQAAKQYLPKKGSGTKLPSFPAWQNPYDAATAGGISMTPALIASGNLPTGFHPSVAPQLQPVGGGFVQTPAPQDNSTWGVPVEQTAPTGIEATLGELFG